jgi:hypothetical protein
VAPRSGGEQRSGARRRSTEVNRCFFVTAISSRRNVPVTPFDQLGYAGSAAAGKDPVSSRGLASTMVTPVLGNVVRLHRSVSVVKAERVGALTEADFRGCRWIEGEPIPLHSGMFCGLPVAPGTSWCAMHHAVVFGLD